MGVSGPKDYLAIQHFLYFLPLPQGHGSLRPVLGVDRAPGARVCGTCCPRFWRRHRAAIAATKGWQ